MPAPLPPIDHVARALLMNGARDHAIALMESVARRGGPDGQRCGALLAAVRARPMDRPTGPVIPLDATLAEAFASNGMLVEARAVARGGRIAAKGGVELAAALEQVLEDPPPQVAAASRRAWAEVIAGSTEAALALERDAAGLDPWLRARVGIASRLLRGFSVHAPTASGAGVEGEAPALPDAIRASLAEKIAARDLPGALAVVRAAQAGDPALGDTVASLARLVAATERLLEEAHETGQRASTTPLGGHGLALFQLRMGNLSEAERAFRRLVVEQANDHVARERLADVIALRRAIDPSLVGLAMPPAGGDAALVLDKKNARPAASGWAAGASSKASAKSPGSDTDEWDRDDATSIMRPEQEADMLVKAGQPERALEILQLLRVRDPGRAGLEARIAEIERMIEQRAAPLPGEHTVQRDVSALRRRSADAPGAGAAAISAAEISAEEKTDPRSAFDDDEATLIGRRPRMEPTPDPLAQTEDRPSVTASRPRARPQAASAAPTTTIAETDATVVAVHRIVRID